MNKLFLIIKREFVAKVRNKSFIVMTFLSPMLFVGIAVLVGYLSSMNKDKATEIAIHDEAGYIKSTFKSNKDYQYTDPATGAYIPNPKTGKWEKELEYRLIKEL